uniref:Uncharacterized protein n=1 Tax=Timema poppense TaxID=170557 RepID=A0A7R9CI17_TIMPO|nr:unnamed protein product [Timema poppensis]
MKYQLLVNIKLELVTPFTLTIQETTSELVIFFAEEHPTSFQDNIVELRETYPTSCLSTAYYYPFGRLPAFSWRESRKTICKTTLSEPNRYPSLGFPVISSLVYCESSALDHAATDAEVSCQHQRSHGDTLYFLVSKTVLSYYLAEIIVLYSLYERASCIHGPCFIDDSTWISEFQVITVYKGSDYKLHNSSRRSDLTFSTLSMRLETIHLAASQLNAFEVVPGELIHPTDIRTSISPSSAVELNTTSALANYTTEAVKIFIKN